ncbi:hypothetical protein [Siccibacter colletis]|uniref:hypothetical protein n=1 Tax=Siccibacter colletis TaxID=1505757 RepID=UPI003CE94762
MNNPAGSAVSQQHHQVQGNPLVMFAGYATRFFLFFFAAISSTILIDRSLLQIISAVLPLKCAIKSEISKFMLQGI